MTTDDHLMVVALDFGTTYSGYAFSTRHGFKTDPLKIHANQAWNSGGKAFLSLKTPHVYFLMTKNSLLYLDMTSKTDTPISLWMANKMTIIIFIASK
jgi:hypothetical protein